jgi:hypothetical protein
VTSLISSAGVQTSSPLSILQSQLTSQVSAGKISSADQSVLSTALDGIDQSLGQGLDNSGSQQLSPQDMKDKVGSLIDQQVSDGKLTTDQASELKNVFAGAAPGSGGTGDSGSTSATTSSGFQSDTLSAFLATLQDSTGQARYSANGQTTSNQVNSLLLNYTS